MGIWVAIGIDVGGVASLASPTLSSNIIGPGMRRGSYWRNLQHIRRAPQRTLIDRPAHGTAVQYSTQTQFREQAIFLGAWGTHMGPFCYPIKGSPLTGA